LSFHKYDKIVYKFLQKYKKYIRNSELIFYSKNKFKLIKMGKDSGKAIAIVALCISLGLGGYIVYDKLLVSPETTNQIAPTSNQYFETNYDFIYPSIPGLWLKMPDLFIEFSIIQGESVYFFYLGQVHLVVAAGDTYFEFRFIIDDIVSITPFCRIDRYSTVNPGGLVVHASLQHYNSTMLPGTHNVTVQYRAGDTADYIHPQNLFVQTFI